MAENKQKSEQAASSGKHSNGKRGPNGKRSGALTTHRPSRLTGSQFFGPLGRLRGEFDRLFDDFFHGWPALTGGAENETGWGLEVQERDDAVVMRVDAPGFEPDDFDVQLHGDHLVLRASESEKSEEDEQYHWHKRELYHSVPLPMEVDAEKIDAQYRNGVLTLTLPKSQASKPRKIAIKG
jgi:HSP20 family protein